MTAKKKTVIDILDAALAVKGGPSQLIDLDGVEISLRRNFTGREAREYVEIWRIDKPNESTDIVKKTVALLSDSDDDAKQAFVERLLQESAPTAARVLGRMAVIAGLRSEDGNFFPGASA